ncbi:MAG: 2-phospho-L-lactate transferase CofD family protein [Nitrososphaerales archaeon]
MKRIGVISGGSGSSKFAIAFSDYVKKNNDFELGYIVNVADNYWYHGLYVCPDIDIITYALSGKLDMSKGWGINSDSFRGKEMLSNLSSAAEEWFSLGDFDSALCLRRTELLQKGWSLSSITNFLRRMLGVKEAVIPASDEPIATFVRTHTGLLHLQQFWLKLKAQPSVSGVEYESLDNALVPSAAASYLSESVIICPANPITSILPTIRIKQIRRKLARCRVVAISPFVGNRPFSGPAGKLMSSLGIESSSFGVAKLYSKFLKILFVDSAEEPEIIRRIKEQGIECIKTNIRIDSEFRNESLSRQIMGLL